MTQQRIRILNDTTINQIAAGEVIENPSSVIKELVENAIDAEASEILIETKAGGRGLIKVVDNGCGMTQDDLFLSVERHATSKLVDVEGLDSLKTLGFRGEALPSIASVSKMLLHSAFSEKEGSCLHMEGGKIVKVFPLPRRKGTTIEVKSLFFNVPVRKKFQKSLNWDLGEIHKVLSKFALCYPSLGLYWIDDEKQLLAFNQQEKSEERVKAILGDEFMSQSLPVEYEKGSLQLRGHLSHPAYHHPNRMRQYLFINQRAVSSFFVSQKVLDGYATRLSPHRYPLFVLHLTLPTSWIDVNVHPQKKEIRLREEEKLSSFILQAVERALERQEKVAPFAVLPPMASRDLFKLPEISQENIQAPKEERAALLCPKVRIVAKVKNYFFVEEAEGIRIIDMLRAMERILFDELTTKQAQLEVQSLLLPIQLHMGGKEGALLCAALKDLNDKGISIRHFGGDAFIVDAIPALLEPEEIEEIIHAYLEEGSWPLKIGKCLKRRAISMEMGSLLIEKLFRCKDSSYTPNGKKIHYLLDETSLGKLCL